MNRENTEYLLTHYPKLFPQASRNAGPMRTLMGFGFECGDGWFALVNSLCAVIQDYIDNRQDPESFNHVKDYPQVEVLQVKEKYGGLRFYTLGHSDEIEHYINTAESMSYHICMTCGSTKDVTLTDGWIEAICKKCLDERTSKK